MYNLDNLKLLLNIRTTEQDDLLNFIMQKIEKTLLLETNLDCLNEKLKIKALDLCVLQYHKLITNGSQSAQKGDVTINASENVDTYKTLI